jgi:hypothetical protein
MTVGAPPTILSYSEVCESVGFNKYWEREEKISFRDFTRDEWSERDEVVGDAYTAIAFDLSRRWS